MALLLGQPGSSPNNPSFCYLEPSERDGFNALATRVQVRDSVYRKFRCFAATFMLCLSSRCHTTHWNTRTEAMAEKKGVSSENLSSSVGRLKT